MELRSRIVNTIKNKLVMELGFRGVSMEKVINIKSIPVSRVRDRCLQNSEQIYTDLDDRNIKSQGRLHTPIVESNVLASCPLPEV